MLSLRLIAVAALVVIAFALPGAAQENPLIGTWKAKVPGSDQELTLAFTEDQVHFGEEAPQSYRIVARNNAFLLYVGKEKQPGIFTPLEDGKAHLALPNGAQLPLTRAAMAPNSGEGTASAETGTAGTTALAAAMVPGDGPLPFGVATPFVPMKANLEQLVKAGWTPIGSSASTEGYTLMLTAGRSFALCTLVPENEGGTSTAFIDCRRLN